MAYLLHILAALASLGFAGTAYAADERLWLVAVCLVVPRGLARLAAGLLVRGRFRLGALLDRLLAVCPIGLQLVVILPGGWGETVEALTGTAIGLEGWPGPALLVGIAPFFVLELLAIDARARLHAAAGTDVRRVRAFQLRLFWSACVPFGGLLAALSLVGATDVLRVHVEEVGLLNLAFAGLLAVVFVAALPGLLRRTWSTAPLAPGPLRDGLEAVARRAGFRCRELLVWSTGHQMANAAVVGLTPGSRLVLFSDALLAQLGPRELAGVFAHEIGHTRRHHALVFTGFGMLFLLGADLALAWIDPERELLLALAFASLLALGYVAFGYLSRRFELEADVEGARILGGTGPLVDALAAVTGAHAHERSSWRHFSTRQRIEFLDRLERDPSVAQRLQRKLRRVTGIAGALLAAVLFVEVFLLASALGTERTIAQLRLGRYGAAAARLADGAEVDADVRVLVERAASLPPDARSPAALEAGGLRALEAGDAVTALELLDLAILRGASELVPVRASVRRVAEGERNVPLSELEPRWSRALGRLGAPPSDSSGLGGRGGGPAGQ